MVVDWLILDIVGLLRFWKAYKLDRDDSALMEKLKETVLAISAWLSKVDDSSLMGNKASFWIDSFSIALHI